jgi:hypothetical protein
VIVMVIITTDVVVPVAILMPGMSVAGIIMGEMVVAATIVVEMKMAVGPEIEMTICIGTDHSAPESLIAGTTDHAHLANVMEISGRLSSLAQMVFGKRTIAV